MISQSNKFRRSAWLYILTAIGCFSLFLSGCGSLNLERFHNTLNRREVKILQSGHEAFFQSDYDKAMRIFSTLYKTGSDPIIRRKALYGLACVSLLEAQDTIQYDEAFSLWNTWFRSASIEFKSEDPRLLDPFIQKFEPPYKKENEIQAMIQSKKTDIQKITQTKEAEIQKLTQTIDNMKKEIKDLKYQIKTIEAIDQKIEKKKKEILTPNQ